MELFQATDFNLGSPSSLLDTGQSTADFICTLVRALLFPFFLCYMERNGAAAFWTEYVLR